MEAILNPEEPVNVALLDHVVHACYDPSNPQQRAANDLLTRFVESDHAWTQVDRILDESSSNNTRFLALQILQTTIKFKWKILPEEQRLGVRNFLVQKIIQLSQNEAVATENRLLLQKMNLTLVHILKHDWPQAWPSFISDLVGASKLSQEICTNNMNILMLLSDEVFGEFSREEMTTAKVERLKTSLNGEFSQIFDLCVYIMELSDNVNLLTTTLQTLAKFITWIPQSYIFETKLVETLCMKFLPAAAFRCDALTCLTEIAMLSVEAKVEYGTVIQNLYIGMMGVLVTNLDESADFAEAYEVGSNEEQGYMQRVALFLTTILRQHLTYVEASHVQPALLTGLKYLLKISEVDDSEIFKMCMDFWHFLCSNLFNSQQKFSAGSVLSLATVAEPRKALYAPVLSALRVLVISHMAKPEEVLVTETDEGDIARVHVKDTDVLALYRTMRETLVFLTHLDYEDTQDIMWTKLSKQVDGSEWSWHALNTLCWAIGSISGAMPEMDEKRFLVAVIKDLLAMTEHQIGKNNKAIVASNIMYVVGQYPRFLKAHWKFLRTVVLKLFEFMHERHPGVQDMACDTFLKIASKLKAKFVTPQGNDPRPFIEELFELLPATIMDLEIRQVHIFYEAVGHMVSAHPDINQRNSYLESLMALPNSMWQRIIASAAADIDTLRTADTAKELQRILCTNVCVCQSVGPTFLKQLGLIYLDMLNVYRAYSECISQAVATSGRNAMQNVSIKMMRAVRKETLTLISTFIKRCDSPSILTDNFLPPMMDPVFGDYRRNVVDTREAEVLLLVEELVLKLKSHMTPHAGPVLEAVFQVTLDMIKENFIDFPDHRANFYRMLTAVATYCFPAIFNIPPEHQGMIVNSMLWAVRHTDRNISEMGCEMLLTFLNNVVSSAPAAEAQAFYSMFFMTILKEVLFVLTDRCHKFAFKEHASLLRLMFGLLERNRVMVPFVEQGGNTAVSPAQFVSEHIAGTLLSNFTHLQPSQVTVFIGGLFQASNEEAVYKALIRDFLIELREFKAEDNADLYLEERNQAAALAQQAEMARLRAVPGLLQMDDLADL